MNARKTICLFIIAFLGVSNGLKALDTYPTLTTLDGTTYTNVEIPSHTATYAIVFYDGGGKKIALTNLPAAVLEKLKVDAAGAALAAKKEAEDKARAQAAARAAQAELARQDSWVGQPQKARITRAFNIGQYELDFGRDDLHSVALPDLPPPQAKFIAEITVLRDALKQMASANTDSYTDSMRMSMAHQKVTMQEALAQMVPHEPAMTSVIVAPTKLKADGLKVWRYIGPGPVLPAPNTASNRLRSP